MAKTELLKKTYFDWLFNENTYTDIKSNIVKINIPFLDNQFDYITMYAVFSHPNKITLTDDGWTIQALESHGVSFSTRHKTNNQLLKTISDSLGVEVIDKELTIKTDIERFPVAKQRLLQCIMQVNDLIVLQKKNILNIFFEEVELLLKENNILYSYKPSFAAKGGITVQFDFSIPTNQPSEKLVRTIRNGNDLNRAKLLTMDTHLLKYSKPNAEYIAIFDNVNYPLSNPEEIQAIFEENSSTKILPLNISEARKNPKVLANVI